MLDDARVHLTRCFDMRRFQHESGRYFHHEHPLAATSLKEPWAATLAGMRGVIETNVHMCRHGVARRTEEGVIFIKQPAGFLTNLPLAAEQLNKTRLGDHQHIVLQ